MKDSIFLSQALSSEFPQMSCWLSGWGWRLATHLSQIGFMQHRRQWEVDTLRTQQTGQRDFIGG